MTVGLSKKEIQEFSFIRLFRGLADRDARSSGLEQEASRAEYARLGKTPETAFSAAIPEEVLAAPLFKRDMTAATTTAGGFLVETGNVSFIEILRNRSACMSLGATRLADMRGNVAVPKQTGAGTAYWLANEASTITESQQTLAQLGLTPKTVGAYTEISRQLLLQSSPSAETLVVNDLTACTALAVDLAGLAGTGVSGQPTGLVNTSGIGSFTGTSVAYAGLLDAVGDVLGANVISGAAFGWATTPTIAGLLAARVKFTSTASPLWEGALSDGTVLGYRAMSSAQVPTGDIIFGDWSSLVIAEWGGLEVAVNPFSSFQSGIVGVRTMYSVDIGVRYPAAFSVATSVT